MELLKEKITQATFIKSEPEKVYAIITSGKGWDQFFTKGSEVDAQKGGKLVFRWKEWGPDLYTTSAEGLVLEAKRPTRFVFQWYPVGKDHPTKVKFDLKKENGGTTVRLTESGYPDKPESRNMMLECAAGWGEALTLLKFYLEHGVVYVPPRKTESRI
jgi:uncharacterized protein YndB with AHSA1/START domain